MLPALVRVRIRRTYIQCQSLQMLRTWIQCQSLQMLRTEAKPEHIRHYLEKQQKHHIDARQPDHDHVQAMTAVKGFGGKWIAVNPLDNNVFGMTQHQIVMQSCWLILAAG
jgi:hypothetical protein